jgi:hypothetical protein
MGVKVDPKPAIQLNSDTHSTCTWSQLQAEPQQHYNPETEVLTKVNVSC